MRLTDQQERLIARHVRETREHLPELSARDRERVLERARADILEAIPPFEGVAPENAGIEHALQTVGSPRRHAQKLMDAARKDSPAAPESSRDRRWLGVCTAISEQSGAPVTLIRWGAVLLGVVTGPFALIIYIGIFLTLHFTERTNSPPIAIGRLVKYVASLVAGAVLLRIVAWGFVTLLGYGYGLLFQHELHLSGLWNWLERNGGSLFFWTLFCLTPVAVLAALPVPPPWRNTLRKLFEAGLALYALALCFGVGCVLAGAIIKASQHLQDPTTIDFQSIFSAI